MDTFDNKATSKAAGTTLLTNRNWCRVPASTSAAAEHGSPSARYVVDEEDTEGDDGTSDDGEQLSLSHLQLFIPCLHQSLRRDSITILYSLFLTFLISLDSLLGVVLSLWLVPMLLADTILFICQSRNCLSL
jgi:hypothetical protein